MKIEKWWRSFYGAAKPISYILRTEITQRWLRIHSLPESKRYAETPEERAILLSRHNEVATKILGEQKNCVLIAAQLVENPTTKIYLANYPEFAGIDFQKWKSFEHFEPQIDPAFGPDVWEIWFSLAEWSSGRFDEIIESVADDKVRHFAFASLENGEIYAPYDGGADLFFQSMARRDEMKMRYKSWLSAHPKGL